MIEATEKTEDRKYISFVKNLVKEYIRRPNSIIAMVISCKDDMENQSIKVKINKLRLIIYYNDNYYSIYVIKIKFNNNNNNSV